MTPFERTNCDCEKCKVPCRFMPGTVAPGELTQIAEYLGEKQDNAFLEKYFQASDGPLVMQRTRSGVVSYQIPTIVPKLTEDGCVFLKDGHCAIHAVAPFGCAMYSVCGDDPASDDQKSKWLLRRIMQQHVDGGGYSQTVKHLAEAGCIAPPLRERKQNFEEELQVMVIRSAIQDTELRKEVT